ncbi:hypothetical protein TWF696_007910 [Orbilia brochopaga]|uniref:Uncharacterized protein n=1 Tax=Orbilia brochopaga TaxID=3140254 RepID=A0AAV9UR19_9PEZI
MPLQLRLHTNGSLCKPSTQGVELQGVLPTERTACPSGSFVWSWDFLPERQRIGRDGNTYFTLIQVTGGPDTEGEPGITNAESPDEYLQYGGLVRNAIFRSQFRVRRNGGYLLMKDDADLRAGDVLEFWGPSSPRYRTLYLEIIPDGTIGFTRALRQEDPSLSPEVEFVVRVPSYSSTKRRLAIETRLWQTGEMGDQVPLQRIGPSEPTCIGSICRATVSGAQRLFQGARNLFSGGSDTQRNGATSKQGKFRYVDDLVTFAGDKGTGRGSISSRSRSRNSVSRKGSTQTLKAANSRVNSDPDRSRYDVSYEDEDSAHAQEVGLGSRFRAPLPRITEATLEDTPGLPTLGTRLGSVLRDPNTGTIGSLQAIDHNTEQILSPHLIPPSLVVEEEASDDEEDSVDGIGINLREVVTEEDMDTRTPYNMYSLTYSSRSPGASRNLIDLTRFTSTQGSQAQGQGTSPAVRQFRRLNAITDFPGVDE